jgi:hypothetical protein
MTAKEAEAFVRERHPKALLLRSGGRGRLYTVWDHHGYCYPDRPTAAEAWKAAVEEIRRSEASGN